MESASKGTVAEPGGYEAMRKGLRESSTNGNRRRNVSRGVLFDEQYDEWRLSRFLTQLCATFRGFVLLEGLMVGTRDGLH